MANPTFKMPTLKYTLRGKRPRIGVTQGGSSRKDAGAKPAATKGEWRPSKKKWR